MAENAIIPIPKIDIAIRVATMADIPFMDGLQKKHSKALGYFPTKQFEGYVESGGVLIAEGRRSEVGVRSSEEEPIAECRAPNADPLGYVISRDRYLKRDELGVIFQLCVAPGNQRKLIGAMLVREVFARSAYGCRLYCCWCAQDLEANRFWESMGFMPIAFRTGSDRKRRVHIFWQRRIVEGDATTPFWYPAQTNGGAIREDRLAFPILPGTHWSEVRAVELPTAGVAASSKSQLQAPNPKRISKTRQIQNPESKIQNRKPGQVAIVVGGKLRYVDRPGQVAPEEPPFPAPSLALLRQARPGKKASKACPERGRRINPNHLAAARELRDRYLERFNAGAAELPQAKYAVGRLLPVREKQGLLAG